MTIRRHRGLMEGILRPLGINLLAASDGLGGLELAERVQSAPGHARHRDARRERLAGAEALRALERRSRRS